MYERPNSKETDDDLLRLQEIFDKAVAEKKINIAANVVPSSSKASQPVESMEVDLQQMECSVANTFESIPHNVQQVKSVQERHVSEECSIQQFKFAKCGFPVAQRRDLKAAWTGPQNGSLFRQSMQRSYTKLTEPHSTISKSMDGILERPKIKLTLPDKSYILSGSEWGDIHNQNIDKLKSLSEHEILEERQRLMDTMDPALIAFLKSRRNENFAKKHPSLDENHQTDAIDNVDNVTINDILSVESSHKWIHFNVVEGEKLAWMADLPQPQNIIAKNEACEARFDFEGWLLPRVMEINDSNRSLYHHGVEPNRPGYTLQELLQLARSDFLQQQIVSLHTIANLLALYQTGVYDGIIELPIEQIFFVLRVSVDSNVPSVLNASLRAMRNLVWYKIDEVCLDAVLPLRPVGEIQPIISADDEQQDDDRLNDQQLCEKNLIRCLLRSDILTRMRYIFETVRPKSWDTIVYCLNILTRLARDSNDIMVRLYKFDNLLNFILENFIPMVANPLSGGGSEQPYGMPILEAVKLFRILIQRSSTIACDLANKSILLDALALYISSGAYSNNTNGMRLQAECFRCWAAFVHYGYGLNHFQILSPVLLELLHYHYTNTNLDEQITYVRESNVAALLLLIGKVGCKQSSLLSDYFIKVLTDCFHKWSKQFITLSKFENGKSQIISSMLMCWTDLYSRAESSRNRIDEMVEAVAQSNFMNTVLQQLPNSSMLLNNYKTWACSPNLRHLETSAWFTRDHIIPIMQTSSPMMLVYAISTYTTHSHSYQLRSRFINHAAIQSYVRMLNAMTNKFSLLTNWFTRIEAHLIRNILFSYISGIEMPPTQQTHTFNNSVFYHLAMGSLCILTKEYKKDIEEILRHIIFNRKLFSTDKIMQQLKLTEDETLISLDSLSAIMDTYINVLQLDKDLVHFHTNLSLDSRSGPVLPQDWIYSPIVALYANKTENVDQSVVLTISNCLKWILIYDSYFPELTTTHISATDKFCRLACVFLASDSLFLVDDIHKLLHGCLESLLKMHGADIDFEQQTEGLGNFQDLFIQLLEQYQSVSYGDTLFGNFLLVPLAQRHRVQFRRTLWSEYVGVVETFGVTAEQCMCPISWFLEPTEKDISLLRCYRKVLASRSVREHSILYTIAKHHVECYVRTLKRKTQDNDEM